MMSSISQSVKMNASRHSDLITLPSIESKKQLDAEIFKDTCPRCFKLDYCCALCGGKNFWFMVEEVLE